MPVVVIGMVLFGLAVGSFLNVVIYRVPNRASLSHPASRCPVCEQPIRNRHNVPVLGWLMLRGRCADCGARISVRYPLVELGTSLLFVALTVRLIGKDQPAAVPAYLYLAAIGISLSLIDLDVKRLPDSIVLPSYPILAVLLTIAALVHHDWTALIRAGIGGIALYALYFAIAFAYPEGMGFGDVKLAGVLGAALAFLSWPALAVGAFGAFVLGGVVGAVVIVSDRGHRKSALPFGPFMVTAAFISVFTADPIWRLYLHIAFGT